MTVLIANERVRENAPDAYRLRGFHLLILGALAWIVAISIAVLVICSL